VRVSGWRQVSTIAAAAVPVGRSMLTLANFRMSDWIDTPNNGIDLQIRLYSNEPDLAAGVTLDSFVEPQFRGYVPRLGNIWAKRVVSADGGPWLVSHFLQWAVQGPWPGGVVRGLFVVAAQEGLSRLIAASRFKRAYDMSRSPLRLGATIRMDSIHTVTTGVEV